MHELKSLNLGFTIEEQELAVCYAVEFNFLCMRLFHNVTILLSVNQHFLVPELQDWDLTLSFRLSVPFFILWCRQLSNLLQSNLLGSSTVPVVIFCSFFGLNTNFFVFIVWILAWGTRNNPSPGQQALSTWQIHVRCSEMTITEEG